MSWQESPLCPPWELDVFIVPVEVKFRGTPGSQEADNQSSPRLTVNQDLQTLRPHTPRGWRRPVWWPPEFGADCLPGLSFPPCSRSSASIRVWCRHRRVPSGSLMLAGLTSEPTGWQIAESLACSMLTSSIWLWGRSRVRGALPRPPRQCVKPACYPSFQL